MCGGTIITQITQIKENNLGYCNKVTVKDFGFNKYSIVEGKPFNCSCTILVCVPNNFDRLNKTIKGTLQSLYLSFQYKCCIKVVFIYKEYNKLS